MDQFSYDFDTYEYKDNVSDREAQIQALTEDIFNGQFEYLQVFLREVIEDAGLPKNVRRAQELSQRLAEYKPLAKVEELEEQNYNMIDNVLNNGAGKRDWKKGSERVSIKQLLAKKKAEITHGHSIAKMVSEKENEKKIERGI